MSTEPKTTRSRSRWQLSVRQLLYLTTISAVLCWWGVKIHAAREEARNMVYTNRLTHGVALHVSGEFPRGNESRNETATSQAPAPKTAPSASCWQLNDLPFLVTIFALLFWLGAKSYRARKETRSAA